MDYTSTPADPQKKSKFFNKSTKWLLIITFAVLLAVFICVKIINISLEHSNLAKEIKKTQIGMCYQVDSMDYEDGREFYYTRLLTFSDNGCNVVAIRFTDESREEVEHVTGSLDEMPVDYTVKIPLLGQPTLNGTKFAVDDQMHIVSYGHYTNTCIPISLEDAQAFAEKHQEAYELKWHNHEYGEAEVIKKATCSSKGEEKSICNICGQEIITETGPIAHNYVNRVCSVCGAKKAAEKSTIEANIWYIYNDVLLYQNCELINAFSAMQGKAMSVHYYAVCQHCHAISETSKLAGPEVNYEVKKIHNCKECGKETIVRFKID